MPLRSPFWRTLVLVAVALCFCAGASAQTFSDSGFISETVIQVDQYGPVGFVFLPDGRMLQIGRAHV